eukprot:CAMPEP_0115317084 /NCGR_PEP_ID=MMETSP0270-20121206/78470_1 /TAXON_ID=71861 /ORGANISM="Scrippsiella trochoidea, Strain CCMP3099" /LENGTH=89 /DNA_ID=CAMNT_0002736539 /DNA_START=13 /DNA_END=278 /DNA_ORIENTATION=-
MALLPAMRPAYQRRPRGPTSEVQPSQQAQNCNCVGRGTDLPCSCRSCSPASPAKLTFERWRSRNGVSPGSATGVRSAPRRGCCAAPCAA